MASNALREPSEQKTGGRPGVNPCALISAGFAGLAGCGFCALLTSAADLPAEQVFFFSAGCSLLAMITGLLARWLIQRGGDQETGRGLALAAVLIGLTVIICLVGFFVMIIAALDSVD